MSSRWELHDWADRQLVYVLSSVSPVEQQQEQGRRSMAKLTKFKSLQATRAGRSSSTIAEDVIHPVCLRSGR